MPHQGRGDWQQYKRLGNAGGEQTFYFEGDPSDFFGRGRAGGSGFSSFFDNFFGGGEKKFESFREERQQRSHHQKRSFRRQALETEMLFTLLENISFYFK